MQHPTNKVTVICVYMCGNLRVVFLTQSKEEKKERKTGRTKRTPEVAEPIRYTQRFFSSVPPAAHQIPLKTFLIKKLKNTKSCFLNAVESRRMVQLVQDIVHGPKVDFVPFIPKVRGL